MSRAASTRRAPVPAHRRGARPARRARGRGRARPTSGTTPTARARSTTELVGRARRRRARRRARRSASPTSRRCSSSRARRATSRVEPEIDDRDRRRCAPTLDQLELRALFTGEHDERDAICEVHSGAGGTDAQDWTDDAAAHVPALGASRRASTVEVDEIAGGPGGRHHVGDVHHQGPLRVRHARRRARRAPADPHLAVRRQRAPPDRVRVVRLRARARAGRGARDRPERPAHRHLPVVGRGRSARQRHRLRGAHHAPADRRRRVVPERALADAEQGEGDADPRGPPRRAAARGAARRSWRRCRATSATSRSATRSARTRSRRTNS